LKEALDRYELDARASGISKSNIIHVKGRVSAFVGFLGDVDNVLGIGADDFRRYLSSLRDRLAWEGSTKQSDKIITGTSIATYARAIKSFWGWLKRMGLLETNPLAAVPTPKKPKTVPVIYQDTELKAIYNIVKDMPKEKSIFLLFLDSGIRLDGLTSLPLADLDLTNHKLKTREKGNKERLAYFSTITAGSIAEYLRTSKVHRPESNVFLDDTGLPLTHRQVQLMLEKVGKQAGLSKRLAPHKLRHTYASLSLRYGANLEHLKITLGHTDIKTTSDSYLSVADAEVAHAHQNFSPVANLFYDVNKTKVKESENQPIQLQRTPYEETPLKRRMRSLAKEIAEGISLPSPLDKTLWRDLPLEFKPGTYHLSLGTVEITENSQIRVTYHDIVAGFAKPHLVKGLLSHLATSEISTFTELAGDKGKLSDLALKAGQYSQALLEFLKLITDEVKGYRAKIDFLDQGKPGLTRWFIISAWIDAIQKAAGHSWIIDSWYKPYESVPGAKLCQSRCGGAVIGIAGSKRTLKIYEIWHKKLIRKFTNNPMATDLADKDQELGIITEDVRQRLQEFSDLDQVPGY